MESQLSRKSDRQLRERMPIHFGGTERFQLLALLGRGASSVVYEALDRERGDRVALKVLAERSPQGIAFFKNEFRSLQEISHPNLVELKELIFDGGHWLLSMQLVRGVDLVSYIWGETALPAALPLGLPLAAAAEDDTIRAWERRTSEGVPSGQAGRAFSEARLRSCFEQLARGLISLHAAGKIHRDVKRSNALVNAEGLLTILDFGLVAELGAHGWVAQEQLLGTPSMMAPEQAALEQVGPASDWYSVGAVLYQALMGRAPFVGTRAEILREKQRALPAPPHQVKSSIPRDLSDLSMELLAREPARRPSGENVLARCAPRRPRPLVARVLPVVKYEPTFVGRKPELGALGEALERVRSGNSVTVVLEGESGVGKTSLVRAFLASIQERGEALAIFPGRCFERESLPYKALDGVMDAVCEHLSRLPGEEVAALLPPDAAAIARAFPVLHQLGGVPSSAGRSASIEPHAQRMRVFAALRELFQRLAKHRLSVVVMDDMQWADIDSMAALSALLEPPAAPAMLWIAIRRPVRGSPIPLPCEVSPIAVGPLSRGESVELVAELLGANSTARTSEQLSELIGEARGHPLFLQELAREVAAGPEHASAPGLDAALWRRISALEPITRQLLELSAVAGRPIAQGVLADALLVGSGERPSARSGEIARLDFARVLDRFTELRHAGLICTAGSHPNDALETYHDRVRETILSRLEPSVRKQSHLLLANALERAGSGDAEALAHHWQGAGARDRAHEYALTAADEAAAALAFERAARLYRDALELGAPSHPRESELARKLADALANAGRGLEAARAYQAAAERADALEGLRLERLAAEQLLRSGHVEQGMSAVSAVLRRLGVATARSRLSAVLSLLWLRVRIRLRGFRYRSRAESEVPALELARLDGAWMAATCLMMFDGIRGAELQFKTTLLALRVGTPLQVLRAHTSEALFLALAGRPMQARIERSLVAAGKLADQLSQPAGAWVALSRGASSFFLGEWAESEESCTTAESIFHERPGSSFELASARAFKVWAAMMRGRFAEVLDRVPGYVAEAENRGDLYAATYQMTSFSNVAWLSRDDVAEARRMLALAESRWPSKHFDVPRYSNMIAAAHIELYAGRGRAAHERICRDWSALRWGIAFRAQITRFGMRFVRGLSALAAFDERPERSLLEDARRCARAIAVERVTWSECFAAILESGVSARAANDERALVALVEAEAKAGATGMLLHRAVARHRRGELLGGEQGRALIEEARQFMTEQKIKNGACMLDMLSPRPRGRV